MSDSDSESSESFEIKVEVKRQDSIESGGSFEKVEEEEETKLEDEANPKEDVMAKSLSAILPQQPRRKRFVPKYEVEGVHRVVIGEETQASIEMVVGSHVSAQFPWKNADKYKILEAIEVGGEKSEFFPLKEFLEAYEPDEVFMGYIPDETNDFDEFYICCTVEARAHCKQQSDKFIKRQQKKLEKALQRKPRPWTSLGSEKEIIEAIPIYSRPLMEIEIKSAFPTQYDPEYFEPRDCFSVRDGYIELTPYRQKFFNVYNRRVDCASQVGEQKKDNVAQTELRYPKNMWTQSIADALGAYQDPGAGGDTQSKGVDELDEDEDEDASDEEGGKSTMEMDDIGLAAFKRAFARMRRPSYVKTIDKFMSQKCEEMSSITELNTVMDIYGNDYPNLILEKSSNLYDTMTFSEYLCFTDVRAKDKYVSSAVFHPMWSGVLAICYSDGSPNVMKYLSTRPDPIQRAVYGLNPVMVWSHIDSLLPKLYLESPREVKVLSFCPFNENLLVGGCVNGQVVIWDLTGKFDKVEKVEVLTETREKYRIAMNAHMGWMKTVSDKAVVPATAMSQLLTSHTGAITAIEWFSPNFIVTNTGKVFSVQDFISRSNIALSDQVEKSLVFFTGSVDGSIMVWNLSFQNVGAEGKKVKKSKRVLIRPAGLTVDVSPYQILDRQLQPCYKIILGIAGRSQTFNVQSIAMDIPALEYVYTPRPGERTGRKYFTCKILQQLQSDVSTTIYSGSQHGQFQKVSWEGHAFNTGELVNSEYADIKFSCSIHDGIISRIQKNPKMPHITLTVGGKIFAIWADDFPEKPLIWKKRPHRLTDGVWSMYKPSLMFIATSDGDLETWDLLLRSDQPIAVQTLSGSMLTGVTLHTLPLKQNIIGVSDMNGSFRMFLDPPIFMIEKSTYLGRMEVLLAREQKVLQSFVKWQEEWMKNNPDILLELKRKEGLLLMEKEEEKRKLREEEERILEEEAEARRLAKSKVIGKEERWQMIINKLIERTIAVKKRINRQELIEQEKPLRELEAQRLEKERRMLEIMKNQKAIFNDTVAILFPEAIVKPKKVKAIFKDSDRNAIKKGFLEDYAILSASSKNTVKEKPYKVSFSWEATLNEGKERRTALNAHEKYIKMHKCRLDEDFRDISNTDSMNRITEGKVPSKVVESASAEHIPA